MAPCFEVPAECVSKEAGLAHYKLRPTGRDSCAAHAHSARYVMPLDPTFINKLPGALSIETRLDWLREDIGGLDREIGDCEERIAQIQKELPALERELLEQQRDLAEYRLARYEKQAELARAKGVKP